jgi:hypothetical protein
VLQDMGTGPIPNVGTSGYFESVVHTSVLISRSYLPGRQDMRYWKSGLSGYHGKPLLILFCL